MGKQEPEVFEAPVSGRLRRWEISSDTNRWPDLCPTKKASSVLPYSLGCTPHIDTFAQIIIVVGLSSLLGFCLSKIDCFVLCLESSLSVYTWSVSHKLK